MQLTPSDVYGHYRPSRCDLRVFLKAHGTIGAEPSPYVKVLRVLGLRHEQKHLATLAEVEDLNAIQDSAELVERTKATVAAILPQEYTLKSRNSRTTKARRILREGLTEEALELISHAERISGYLDASCAAIDAALSTKRGQLETLDALRKSIITPAVTRGLKSGVRLRETGNLWLDRVPTQWDLISLKRISAIQTGLTLGKTYEGVLIERPYLRVANVQDGHLELDDVTIIEVPPSVATRVALKANDVLMTEGGDLDKLGRGFLWHGEIEGCLHQNHIFAVRCFDHKLLPRFLTYLTSSQYGRAYFEATGKRTTNLAATNSTKVGLFPIPLPSITEQGQIVEYLDERLAQVQTVQRHLESQIQTLTGYRKSLIHECITGQRRVTDADLKHVQSHA